MSDTTYGWHNPHPFWQRLGFAVVVMGGATLFAWLNASNFDRTEIIMLSELAGVVLGREAIGLWMSKKS